MNLEQSVHKPPTNRPIFGNERESGGEFSPSQPAARYQVSWAVGQPATSRRVKPKARKQSAPPALAPLPTPDACSAGTAVGGAARAARSRRSSSQKRSTRRRLLSPRRPRAAFIPGLWLNSGMVTCLS